MDSLHMSALSSTIGRRGSALRPAAAAAASSRAAATRATCADAPHGVAQSTLMMHAAELIDSEAVQVAVRTTKPMAPRMRAAWAWLDGPYRLLFQLEGLVRQISVDHRRRGHGLSTRGELGHVRIADAEDCGGEAVHVPG